MPWVRLDDRFPSHRKVALLSDRAFRLYVSALCWASENLTEGLIRDEELRVIAHVRGMKAAAKELEDRQLWDRVDAGWQIHDFLEYNPDRGKIKADRQANSARQQAFRDRKKAERDAQKATQEAKEDPDRNAVTPPVTHSVSNGAPVPVPSPSVVSPAEKQRQEPASYEEPARIGDRPRIPDASRALVEKITAQGMVVGWDLQPNEWFLIEALIRRCGVDALVVSAVGSWQGARRQPRSGRYFIPAWRDVPDVPAPDGPWGESLPVAVGQVVPINGPQRPAVSDVRSQAALDAGRRLQALADAQNQENK